MDSKSAWMIIVALVVVVATVLIATQWGGVSNGGSSSTTVDPAVRMANPRFMHSPFKVESAQDWHQIAHHPPGAENMISKTQDYHAERRAEGVSYAQMKPMAYDTGHGAKHLERRDRYPLQRGNFMGPAIVRDHKIHKQQ